MRPTDERRRTQVTFDLPLWSFYLFGAVTVLAALAVITLKNPVHAALCLVLTFFSTACIWLLADAEFLAIALVLVYGGRGHGAVLVRRDDARYRSRAFARRVRARDAARSSPSRSSCWPKC
jgi:hypothetical protein